MKKVIRGKDDYLYMNGGAIFNFYFETVPVLVRQLLDKSGSQKEEIDYFIFHQANKFMLNTIRKGCVLPKEKFYVSLENTGNTVSSTVLIGLKDCLLNGTIKAGMQVVVAGFGGRTELGRYDIEIFKSELRYGYF